MVRIMPMIGATILGFIPLSLGFDKKDIAVEKQTPIPIQSSGAKPGFDLNKLPYCFFWTGEFEGAKIKVELATFNDKRLEKSLRKQGIVNPTEIKEAIKYINNKVKEFNNLLIGNKVNLIEFGKDRRIDNPVLKPSVSPNESVKKYHLAWSAFPIVLKNKAPKEINMSSLAIRTFVDPSDGKTNKGIYFEYIPQDKNKKAEWVLLPEPVNLAIFDDRQVHLTTNLVPVFGPPDD